MSEPTSGKSEDSVAVPGILLVLLSKSRFPLLKLLSATFSALLLLFGFLFATAGAAIWLMRTSRLELPGVKLLAATQQAIVPAAAGWVPVNPNPEQPLPKHARFKFSVSGSVHIAYHQEMDYSNWQYHARQPGFKFPTSCEDQKPYLDGAGHWIADWCTYDTACDLDKGDDQEARLSPIGRTGQLVYAIGSQPLRGIQDQKENADVKYGVITSENSIVETDDTHRFLSLAVNDWVVDCSVEHFKNLCNAFKGFGEMVDQAWATKCVDRRNDFIMDSRRLKGTYYADNAGAYVVQLIALGAE